MTQSTVSGFFTGGGKGITWPDEPGKDGGRVSVTGTITAVHPPEPVKDPKTGLPTDREQVRIDLATDERDPSLEFDDGSRTLYVKSYMRSAIGEALRRLGEKEPKVGGKLFVRFVRTEAPDRPGLSPSKIYEAQYQPPAVTGDYFNGGQAAQQPAPATPPAWAQQPQQPAAPQWPAQPPAQQWPPAQPAAPAQPPAAQWPVGGVPAAPAEPAKPANIPQAAWDTMDANTRAIVAGQQPSAPAGPAKPASIPQAAWDAMPPAEQANVAAAMAVLGQQNPV